MVFNSVLDIFMLIENPFNSKIIERGKEIKKEHELHVQGKNLKKFLKKIDKIENQEALELREKLANEITLTLTSQTLKPINKVFSASGSSW